MPDSPQAQIDFRKLHTEIHNINNNLNKVYPRLNGTVNNLIHPNMDEDEKIKSVLTIYIQTSRVLELFESMNQLMLNILLDVAVNRLIPEKPHSGLVIPRGIDL